MGVLQCVQLRTSACATPELENRWSDVKDRMCDDSFAGADAFVATKGSSRPVQWEDSVSSAAWQVPASHVHHPWVSFPRRAPRELPSAPACPLPRELSPVLPRYVRTVRRCSEVAHPGPVRTVPASGALGLGGSFPGDSIRATCYAVTAIRACETRQDRRRAVRTSRRRRIWRRACTQSPCCRRGFEVAYPPRRPAGRGGESPDSARRPLPVDASTRSLPARLRMRCLRRAPHPRPRPVSVHAGRETPGKPPPTSCSPPAP